MSKEELESSVAWLSV